MVFAILIDYITALISALGYPGVFVLMTLESILFPVPSEAVMPFAGFLVTAGRFEFWAVAIVSAFGSLLGSLISYAIGYYGATPVVHKYGHFLLIEKKHLTWVNKFFRNRGSITVFVCRFIPVIRHISSIPAGIARMKIWRFSFYTFTGALLWNTFLLWLGTKLGQHWTVIKQYTFWLDIAVGFILVVLVAYYVHAVYVRSKARNKKK